ncbi:MAG: TRAP transporter large permease subunit, partial [Alicyclobacillus sp.]|nr:TRAP transporter large permease subunit [Alicyclobacillus sp.]
FLVIKALPPEVAGLYSLPFMVVFSFFNKDRSGWLTPRRLWQAGAAAVRGWLVIATVTGTVGLLIGSLDLSGLGIKFSDFIIQLGHGSLIFTLLLTGLASLILGMGLDATPAYMTLAILTAPALVKLGLTPVQAHLYVIFWGLASFLTPPVCLAVYVACSISGSKVWATGWQAMRLGAAAFLVSIAFALNNALLLNGPFWDVALSVMTALLGTVCIAACFEGWSFRLLTWPQRVILFVAGVLLIGPGVMTALVALVLVLGVLVWQWYQRLQGKQDVGVTA